ncbi:MAG: hypothetical protein QXF95_07045 [Candidatus Caldarchaeum sp.]
MRLRTYLVGAFPRTASLIKSFRDYAKGKIAHSQLLDEINRSVKQVVGLQRENNLTYLSDGMLTWDDLFRPVALSLNGVTVNGLSRWYDNNVFFKKPVIVDKVSCKKTFDNYFSNKDALHGLNAKAVLPDPFTMAVLSENRTGHRVDEVAIQLAEAIAEIAAGLDGVSQIQLTAPTLVFKKPSKNELELAKQCVDIVKRKVGGELMLHMPFGSASNVFPHLLDFSADVIGIDLYRTSVKEIVDYSIGKKLFLGVLDGRNTLMESNEMVFKIVGDIVSKTGLGELDIGPCCELEFLPYEVAAEKVRKLGELKKLEGERFG